MCKAFSCIVKRNRKVYWKLGLDGHEEIKEHFKLDDNNVNSLCPIEIVPNNGNYIFPDKWNFKFDISCPDWWKMSHEKVTWSAHKKWLKQLETKIHRNRLKNIIHPFKLPKVKQVTKIDINNLKKWDSVGASVEDSVWDSVRGSVWASVGASVWASVEDSVGASVRASVRAYCGWNFKLKRSEWLYTDKIKTKGYPFMPLIKLWKRGLVPSFDGKNWRLHSGKKAKVVYTITQKELRKM